MIPRLEIVRGRELEKIVGSEPFNRDANLRGWPFWQQGNGNFTDDVAAALDRQPRSVFVVIEELR